MSANPLPHGRQRVSRGTGIENVVAEDALFATRVDGMADSDIAFDAFY